MKESEEEMKKTVSSSSSSLLLLYVMRAIELMLEVLSLYTVHT